MNKFRRRGFRVHHTRAPGAKLKVLGADEKPSLDTSIGQLIRDLAPVAKKEAEEEKGKDDPEEPALGSKPLKPPTVKRPGLRLVVAPHVASGR